MIKQIIVIKINLGGNTTSNTLISGTSDADSVYNRGQNVTINAGTGNDTVYNSYGYNSRISLGDGDDSVYNYYGNNVSLVGGAG